MAAACAALLAACGGDGEGRRAGTLPADTVERTTRVEVVEQQGGSDGFDARAIYRRASPGVVTVISVFEDAEGGGLGGLFGGPGDKEPPDEEGDPRGGLGSGFVVGGDGLVATNAHVVTQGEGGDITEADEVYVKFADDNQVPAEIVGFDPNADVALLRLKERDGLTLRPLPLGRSREVKVGDPVAAIGSPFGEEQSLSVGVVSATDRAIESLTGFDTLGAVQTDAAINQGNSGGPLIDGDGEVIGINAQIRTRSGGGEGVGYAIPVDNVRRSIEDIKRTGEVRYAYLGVSTTAVYPQLAERFDLGTDHGAWVQEVVEGGPAAKAGVRAGRGEERFQARPVVPGGDVITKIDGNEIDTETELGIIIGNKRPGETVTLEILRDGERQEIEVELAERPEQVDRP
ncbi:MAG TPA: trypsin-like peptidase domain-containing protein [Solirubrobacteraceae bacterium]|nr:trypsin-like peptidase domain-containing protein [Solirubrobacteraceae bacterium]